ncbi:MAG: DUF721 domain-containing protein [Bacteroidia bacterium]|nr:DUF721 domain-containing protein [Bacteroidia bacterium]
MKGRNLYSIAEAIELWQQKAGWGDNLISHQIAQNLPQWMGSRLVQDIHSVLFKQGNLTIFVQNSVIQTELTYAKQTLQTNLNRHLGKDVIRNISIELSNSVPG